MGQVDLQITPYYIRMMHLQCKCNANAMQMQCKCNANAMQMQCKCNAKVFLKERKTRKEKEIRLNRGKYGEVDLQITPYYIRMMHLQCKCNANALQMLCKCNANAYTKKRKQKKKKISPFTPIRKRK